MTNISSPTSSKVAFDPNHGRQPVDFFVKGVSERVRMLSTSRPFVLFVIAAALVVGVYYFLMATPIYVSSANVSIRGREEPTGAGSLLGALTGGGGGGGATGTDIAEVQNFITSYQMADKLDQRFHLREMYSRPRLDFLNRIPAHASRERFLNFYKKMVIVKIDHDAALITIEARAFDPATAQKIDQAMLEITSDYINNISDVVRQDTLRTSEQDLQEAEGDVRKARLDMTNYRAATGMLDPAATAAGKAGGMIAMQQEIRESRAEMSQLLSINRPDAPEARQLQARIDGLEQQLVAEQKTISNLKAGDNITQQLREFEGLTLANEYADRKLVAALAAYDAARGLADQRQRFIVAVVPPNLPQEAALPHRMMAFLETMLVLVAVYGIVALAIAGIRDHQGI